MALVYGDVMLNAAANADCLHAPMLLNRDSGKLGAKPMRNPAQQYSLGYDSGYKTPHDPFRWAIVKEAVDNASLDIYGVKADTEFEALDTITGGGKVLKFTLGLLGNASGVTLVRQGSRKEPGLYSPDPKRDKIYYVSPKAAGTKSSSLPHEFFGHWFLDHKGAPSRHRRGDIITSAHKILDPLGELYTGPAAEVRGTGDFGFVELYAGDEGKRLTSPISRTLYVEPPRKGGFFDQKLAEFNRLVGPEMSKPGLKFDNKDFLWAWIYLSNNHEASMLAFVRSGRKKKVLDVLTPVFEAYKLLDGKQKVRFEKFVFAVVTGGTNFVGLDSNTRLAEDTHKLITAQKIASGSP